MRRIRTRLTFANVVSLSALFVTLGGTALASVIITSNSQVASNTISGHKPPSGKHPNVIAGVIRLTCAANPWTQTSPTTALAKVIAAHVNVISIRQANG